MTQQKAGHPLDASNAANRPSKDRLQYLADSSIDHVHASDYAEDIAAQVARPVCTAIKPRRS